LREWKGFIIQAWTCWSFPAPINFFEYLCPLVSWICYCVMHTITAWFCTRPGCLFPSWIHSCNILIGMLLLTWTLSYDVKYALGGSPVLWPA
jgi:hypothetical protein